MRTSRGAPQVRKKKKKIPPSQQASQWHVMDSYAANSVEGSSTSGSKRKSDSFLNNIHVLHEGGAIGKSILNFEDVDTLSNLHAEIQASGQRT